MDLGPLKTGVLTRVEYRVFENECDVDWAHDTSPKHELDREVALEFSDGRRAYASWAPIDDAAYTGNDTFGLSIASESHWSDAPFQTIDMSASPMWTDLIDQQVAVDRLDDYDFVVRLSAGERAVFLWSIDDIVAVGRNEPTSEAKPVA